ncbi:hypothetical protein MA16_Dca006845 [Dendrobium catenatum]|uniref:Uncharacterized protein n=1 Tax=Dendrobium catenatum TaxID=906689 RepID=A0A2I0VSY2_9ASPA|nr:hypothetical protein MA16_Dca006845 [Dendrobium catenatum]
MADPEFEWGIVFNTDGSINILKSPCFDVGFEDDATVEKYLDRVVPILVSIIDQRFSRYDWSLVSHPLHPSLPATSPPTKFFGANFVVVISLIIWLFFLH